MPTQIKAIQCPNCSSPQKVELRPGDYRCQSCGTEYFIDDGTVKFGQSPKPVIPVKPAKSGRAAAWIALALLIGVCVLIAVLSTSTSSTSNQGGANAGYNWHTGYESVLYLSADRRPVLLTLGTRVMWDESKKNIDTVAFNDVRDGSVIAMLPFPDAASVPKNSHSTDFDARQFSNGEIFVIIEKTQLFQVSTTSFTLSDVSRSKFADQPQLAKGIAKIEFMYPTEGEGFKLITNEGKTYYYYPLQHELRTDQVPTGYGYFDGPPSANAPQKSGVNFTGPWNSDYPDVPAQLIAFRYKVQPYVNQVPQLGHVEGKTWADAGYLQSEGIVSHHDFTPGKIYFDYGVLYADEDYVLISYRPTPGKNAPRYVQLLNARTAAVIFTTPLEVLYAPTLCIRYADGFAIDSAPDMYALSFSGTLVKHTPVMYQRDH
jgi:hypothetical protein